MGDRKGATPPPCDLANGYYRAKDLRRACCQWPTLYKQRVAGRGETESKRSSRRGGGTVTEDGVNGVERNLKTPSERAWRCRLARMNASYVFTDPREESGRAYTRAGLPVLFAASPARSRAALSRSLSSSSPRKRVPDVSVPARRRRRG